MSLAIYISNDQYNKIQKMKEDLVKEYELKHPDRKKDSWPSIIFINHKMYVPIIDGKVGDLTYNNIVLGPVSFKKDNTYTICYPIDKDYEYLHFVNQNKNFILMFYRLSSPTYQCNVSQALDTTNKTKLADFTSDDF